MYLHISLPERRVGGQPVKVCHGVRPAGLGVVELELRGVVVVDGRNQRQRVRADLGEA